MTRPATTFVRACISTLLALLLCTALATTFVRLPLELMLDKTDLAVHGAVSSMSSGMRGDEPWTEVTFRLIRDLLADEGDEAEQEFTLSFLGGSRPDGSMVTVELMPLFNEGDEVLMLAYAEDYYSPIVGFNQAVWWLQPDGRWMDSQAVQLGVNEETGKLQLAAGGSSDQVIAALAAELGGR